MADTTPSSVLSRAADLIRDTARQAGSEHDCLRESCGGWHDDRGPCGGCCSVPPISSMGGGRLARLVPYRIRHFHRAYAASHGYFWLPCPLCDQPFGGHEWSGDVPDPTRGPWSSLGICSRCTKARSS